MLEQRLLLVLLTTFRECILLHSPTKARMLEAGNARFEIVFASLDQIQGVEPS